MPPPAPSTRQYTAFFDGVAALHQGQHDDGGEAAEAVRRRMVRPLTRALCPDVTAHLKAFIATAPQRMLPPARQCTDRTDAVWKVALLGILGNKIEEAIGLGRRTARFDCLHLVRDLRAAGIKHDEARDLNYERLDAEQEAQDYPAFLAADSKAYLDAAKRVLIREGYSCEILGPHDPAAYGEWVLSVSWA